MELYLFQVNGVQSRCCEIRPRSDGDGFGLYATQDMAQGAHSFPSRSPSNCKVRFVKRPVD